MVVSCGSNIGDASTAPNSGEDTHDLVWNKSSAAPPAVPIVGMAMGPGRQARHTAAYEAQVNTHKQRLASHHRPPHRSQIESEKGRLAVEGTFMPPPLADSVARSSILGADLSHGQDVQRQPPRQPALPGAVAMDGDGAIRALHKAALSSGNTEYTPASFLGFVSSSANQNNGNSTSGTSGNGALLGHGTEEDNYQEPRRRPGPFDTSHPPLPAYTRPNSTPIAASSDEESRRHDESAPKSRRNKSCYLILTVFLLVIGGGVGAAMALSGGKDAGTPMGDKNSTTPTSVSDPAVTAQQKAALRLQLASLSSDPSVLDDPTSPQGQALDWVLGDLQPSDLKLDGGDEARIETRYALAVLYYSTKGDSWTFPTNFLEPVHECDWSNVTCNMSGSQEVVMISLGTCDFGNFAISGIWTQGNHPGGIDGDVISRRLEIVGQFANRVLALGTRFTFHVDALGSFNQ
jgi:hypothetical protein